jgi:hypothetical protein
MKQLLARTKLQLYQKKTKLQVKFPKNYITNEMIRAYAIISISIIDHFPPSLLGSSMKLEQK